MKKMKRLFSLLTVLFLCMTMLSLSLPTSAATYGQLTYEIVDGEVTVTGWDQNATGSLTIPDTIEGYPVTAIGDSAFFNHPGITDVVIPEGVSVIGDNAFWRCTALTAVSLPNSINAIGHSAFSLCPKLNYSLFDQGKYLGNEKNPYVALMDASVYNITDCTIHPDTKIIGAAAFYECDLLKSIVIPEGIRYIGVFAFHGCDGLKRIFFHGDAPVFGLDSDDCISHMDDPWGDFDAEPFLGHEYGSFESVHATAYYPGNAAGWEAVTSQSMTGRGCGYASARGRITFQQIGSANLSGSITAFGQGALSMKLVSRQGKERFFSLTDSTYQLSDIPPGHYTLNVSQAGSVTRSYSMTLIMGDNALDLKLHQPGDINGNGLYNMGDVARIYAHVKSTAVLSGYELLCADATGDGTVNVGDTSKVYAIVRNS